MAPLAASTSSQLRQLIYYHLDNNFLKNALFLAQRLVAHEGSRNAEAAYLLAYCQFQAGYTKASWDTSRPFVSKGQHLGCCYVFAQACFELGRFLEGLQALDRSRVLWQNRNTWNQHNESRRQHLPDAAAVLCLKGKLWKGHKNMEDAVQCWVASLQRNPFMWDAYTLLVESGAQIQVPNIYKLNPDMVNMIHAQYAVKEQPQEKPLSNSSLPQQMTNHHSIPDPFVSTQKPNGNATSVLYEKLNTSKLNINAANNIHDDEMMNTPSTVVDHEDSMMQHANGNTRHDNSSAALRRPRSVVEAPAEPQSRIKTTSTRVKTRLKTASEDPLQEPPPPGPPSKRTISGQVAPTQIEPIRRTTRSQTSRPPSVTSTNKMSSIANSLGLRQERDIKKARAPALKPRTATASTVGRAVSGNRMKTATSVEPEAELREPRPVPAPTMSAMIEPPPRKENHAEKDVEAVKTLLNLFCSLAQAYNHLQHYDCMDAIKIYNALPSNHRETPYVLAQLGRAYNEIAQYAEAEKYFIRVRQLAPSRLEDMEIYSTVLYQLKSEIELAYLAHELVEIERNSPQTWIAIGNSFSLQREHEQALKCFRRATQLDPSFAYGFTLQGHEYIENEEFEKALNAYRSAIAADQRHYNAWYGLGKCYIKLGKFPAAESHYRTAVAINGSNAVLQCALGAVVEKTKPLEHALRHYHRACELAPKSALSRFKKARCLMSLSRPEEALIELEFLKDIAPEEANVWFLSGRLCKMLGRKAEAVRAFTVALNLDPKVSWVVRHTETTDTNMSRLHNLSKMPWRVLTKKKILAIPTATKTCAKTILVFSLIEEHQHESDRYYFTANTHRKKDNVSGCSVHTKRTLKVTSFGITT